ncbi:unnamed protein product [Linum trigynum]|uniref:Uncharacterized protein n=1 Tax=Linum trigynum TaxID=586398 RepID=A0AAV2F8L7_9ROSI
MCPSRRLVVADVGQEEDRRSPDLKHIEAGSSKLGINNWRPPWGPMRLIPTNRQSSKTKWTHRICKAKPGFVKMQLQTSFELLSQRIEDPNKMDMHDMQTEDGIRQDTTPNINQVVIFKNRGSQ